LLLLELLEAGVGISVRPHDRRSEEGEPGDRPIFLDGIGRRPFLAHGSFSRAGRSRGLPSEYGRGSYQARGLAYAEASIQTPRSFSAPGSPPGLDAAQEKERPCVEPAGARSARMTASARKHTKRESRSMRKDTQLRRWSLASQRQREMAVRTSEVSVVPERSKNEMIEARV